MDDMDIDQVVEVPDTPDRIAAQNINGKDFIRRENYSSISNRSENSEFSDEGLKNQPRNKNKLATDRGSQRLLVRPLNDFCNSDNIENHRNFRISAVGNAASSRNALTLKRNAVDKTINHEDKSEFSYEGLKNKPRNKNKLATDRGSQRLLVRPRNDLCNSGNSENQRNFIISALGNAASSRNVDKTVDHEDKFFIHPQPTGKGKALSTSQSQMYDCKGHGVVLDLSEHSGHSKVCSNVIPRNSRSEECRKEISVSSCPFHFAENSPAVYNNACRVKEKLVDTDNVHASLDRGKGIEIVAESQPNSGRAMPTSVHLSTSHRISGQKRLVRNGCISPLNVEKAKQSAHKHISSFVNPERNDTGTARELISEANDSHRVKGKGVLTHNFSSKESDAKTMPLSSWSSTLYGKDDGTTDANQDAFECSGGLGGWRSTRNRTRKLNAPFSDEEVLVSSRKDDPCKVNEPHRNGVVRRDYKNGSNAKNCSYYPKDQQSVSCQDVSASPMVQTVSHFKHQVDQLNEHQHAENILIKKQKQVSTGSHQDESSSSVFDNSELVILGSLGEPSNIRSTRTLNNHNACSSNPVIEIDEFSPKIRNGGSHSIDCSSNVDSDVRARQLEADEILARELQEQLYNEAPGVGVRELFTSGQIDEHIALALQQEESSHASSSGSHHVSHPQGSLIPDLQRQTQSRSSQNPSTRRGTRARVPTSTRVGRLRGRFPGQPRTISSTQRNSLFHPNVDVDMRIHILEALEAFSDMGMAGGFLQTQRDFNENDYEMLLALDENNHQHGGASLAQINGLPQSTVQSDNLEECSICLETPSIGDTIRHLPCLHRFHKDCIDPWLSRRPSCPVCKLSIT